MRGFRVLFGSVRLAIALIACLVLTGILATIVPQGEDAAFYLKRYGGAAGGLIRATGFDRFFSSPFFIILIALFAVNLATCAIGRFLRERRAGSRRFGPDVIHLGLIVLLAGAGYSAASRNVGYLEASPGDSLTLPGGFVLAVRDVSSTSYPDGRPRDYLTLVDVSKDWKILRTGYRIGVNHPLSIGGMSVYQMAYAEKEVSEDGDGSGSGAEDAASLAAGRSAQAGESTQASKASGPAAPALAGTSTIAVSELMVVTDPAWPLVFAALVVVLFGIVLTFARKLREEKP